MNCLQFAGRNANTSQQLWLQSVTMVLSQYGLEPSFDPISLLLLQQLPDSIQQVFKSLLLSVPRNSIGGVESDFEWLVAVLNLLAGDFSDALEGLRGVEWSLTPEAKPYWLVDRVIAGLFAHEDLQLQLSVTAEIQPLLERLLPGLSRQRWQWQNLGAWSVWQVVKSRKIVTSYAHNSVHRDNIDQYRRIESPFLAELTAYYESENAVSYEYKCNESLITEIRDAPATLLLPQSIYDLARGLSELHDAGIKHNALSPHCFQFNSNHHCWQLTAAQPSFDQNKLRQTITRSQMLAVGLESFDPRAIFQAADFSAESDFYSLSKALQTIAQFHVIDDLVSKTLEAFESLHPVLIQKAIAELRNHCEEPSRESTSVDSQSTRRQSTKNLQTEVKPDLPVAVESQHGRRQRSLSQPGEIPDFVKFRHYEPLSDSPTSCFKEAVRILRRPATLAEARLLQPVRERLEQCVAKLKSHRQDKLIASVKRLIPSEAWLGVRREMLVVVAPNLACINEQKRSRLDAARVANSDRSAAVSAFLVEKTARPYSKVSYQEAQRLITNTGLELPSWEQWQLLTEFGPEDFRLPALGYEWLAKSRRQGRAVAAQVVGFRPGPSSPRSNAESTEIFVSWFVTHRPAAATRVRGVLPLWL